MKTLFISDSFKGSISSARAAELFLELASSMWPEMEVDAFPAADGGEGSVDALVAACAGKHMGAKVHGPLGDVLEANWGLISEHSAVVEMAAASGLTLIEKERRNPLFTSTYGTGELISAALDAGADEITLALGGSATNDAGMGCMRALGARFLDASGEELEGKGEDLEKVTSIDLSNFDERVSSCHFVLMCDVDNPLLGERGCAAVFAPQKGANKKCVERLERGMVSFARVLFDCFGRNLSSSPGAGAAGGMGIAAMLFLGAEMRSGTEQMLDLIQVDELLKTHELVVTGEGHADSQSLHGKLVSGLAKRCKASSRPCIAIVGGASADAYELLDCGVSTIVPTIEDVMPMEQVLARAEESYRHAVMRVLTLLRTGSELE